jgi:hypothetical protein
MKEIFLHPINYLIHLNLHLILINSETLTTTLFAVLQIIEDSQQQVFLVIQFQMESLKKD